MIFAGSFLCGANWDNNSWLEKVKELEEKVAKSEQESKDANEKLDEAVKNKNEKIKEKTVVVKQYIEKELVKYDKQCVIPKEFIKAHNKAVEHDK